MSFHHTERINKCYKSKRCQWCKEFILKNESYYKHVGVYYGDFYHYKVHPECNAAMESYFNLNRDVDEMPDDTMRRGEVIPL